MNYRKGVICAKKETLYIYILLVRSQMVYCSSLWRHKQLKDNILLKRVQRRARRFTLQNSLLDYKEPSHYPEDTTSVMYFELADIMILVK